MPNEYKHYDIVIAGGGLAGTALALALQNSRWRIALVEAHLPAQHQQRIEDMRSLALSAASQKILESLGLWQKLEAFAAPIEKIHVSEAKRFGKTVLDAHALGLPPFGYVIPLPVLYQHLQAGLNLNHIDLFCPAEITAVTRQADDWLLQMNDQKIRATLLIAADGEKSFIRDSLKIAIKKTDYQQTAIVTSAQISVPHNNKAYERITSRGVLAVLPLREKKRAAVIWTVPHQYAAQISENLMAETQSALGYRAGKFSQFGRIQTYPLKAMHAQRQTLPGFFLVGNAAHVMHPMAAQGLNLSLRDAAALAALIKKTANLNDPVLAESYVKLREADQQQTKCFTDSLVKLTSLPFLPLSVLRSLSLSAFDALSPLKRLFCLNRMGY